MRSGRKSNTELTVFGLLKRQADRWRQWRWTPTPTNGYRVSLLAAATQNRIDCITINFRLDHPARIVRMIVTASQLHTEFLLQPLSQLERICERRLLLPALFPAGSIGLHCRTVVGNISSDADRLLPTILRYRDCRAVKWKAAVFADNFSHTVP
jgi:hypothetical protein